MSTDRHPEPGGLPPLDPPLPEQVAVGDIVLRMWRADDAPALAAAVTANTEHLRPFMDWIAHEPTPMAQRVAMIAGWRAERDAGGGAVYGILRGEQVLGGTGLHRRSDTDCLEIGYWLVADEQGRGIATRIVHALTAVALAHPMVNRVEIHNDAANTRSAAVAARAGYRLAEQYQRPSLAPADSGTGMRWCYP